MRTVSHHLLRRRARAKAHALNAVADRGHRYIVEKAARGPFRWRVVEVRAHDRRR